MPLKLTMKEILIAARKAIDENRLQAQARFKGETYTTMCFYRDGKFCCAIGSALPDSFFEEYPNVEGKRVQALIDLGQLELPMDEWEDATILQKFHDSVVSVFSEVTAYSTFLHKLSFLEQKYGVV